MKKLLLLTFLLPGCITIDTTPQKVKKCPVVKKKIAPQPVIDCKGKIINWISTEREVNLFN